MDRRSEDRVTNSSARKPQRSGALSPFVGREEEIQRLTEALDRAAEGEGGTIFLTGEPGIGKTRLAREVLALAKDRGFTVLEGRAFPLEAGLAYAPILDAFGPLLRSLDSARLEVLVGELPSLGRLFDGLRLPPPEPLGDPALEKTRLFEAISRLLERLTQEAPVALLIDDIHRVDPASLELLLYLARGLSNKNSLLFSTYRSDALNTSSSLRTAVTSLLRDGLAEEIIVPRLAPDAVDKLVRALLGGDVPADLVALLDSRARGTPLFVEALVAALIDSGNLVRSNHGWLLDHEKPVALPRTVRHLILERLERLAPSERRIIDLIAIMGGGTSHTILRAASGLNEENLLEALQRLRAAGLVADEMDALDVAYSITHPLIQEVAYAEQPPAARQRGHIVAIQTLESFSEEQPDNILNLARHYRDAGSEADPDRAVAALVAAGERALAIYANEEAARHFEGALALVRKGWRAPLLGELEKPLVPWLLERLGDAWKRIGKLEAAVEVWGEALAERESAGDALAASRLRRHLAKAEWDLGHFNSAQAHLTAGLASLTGRDPCQELADLHFLRFDICCRIGDVAGLANTDAALLSITTKMASPRTEAEANLVAATSCLWQNDVVTARKRALHALMVAEQAQDLLITWRVHEELVKIGMRLGDHQFMRDHAERGLAVAQRSGVPFLEVVPRSQLAVASFMAGEWDKSLHYSAEAVMLARRVAGPRDLAYCLAERGMILAFKGDSVEAKACIFQVRAAVGGSSWEGPADRAIFDAIDLAEMAFALEQSQVEPALDIARGFDCSSASSAITVSPIHSSMPMALMLLAEAQVRAGNPLSALETARSITDLGPTDAPYLVALASRSEGLARQALCQPEAAMVCFRRAYETFSSLDMPFEAARSLLEQGILAPPAMRELATTKGRESLAIFERLGARRYADRARQLLRGLGISLPAPLQTHGRAGHLSARELEVAQLIAGGLNTAEVAQHLTISPRTVTTHLHRIYARLNVRSRSDLVRYMIQGGPIGTGPGNERA
ncbi:MAG: DUF2791 family P-loop domain-containing protein [Dehalococcoidia bacterium]|nr:DUF2791 family P-loop domain-containing protein [Dehalococcoidia bacterium]